MSTPAPDPDRRALLAIIALLICVLVIGTIIVGQGLLTPIPVSKTNAGGVPRDGAAAIEAGIEAATQYQRDRKFAEAAAILAKLSEQSPTDRAVRIAYAQALIGLEKHTEAYSQYQAAIALSGDSPSKSSAPTPPKRDPVLAQLHFEAGTTANMANLTARAEEHYSMAQTLDPGESRYPLFLAMMQIKRDDDAAAAGSLLRAVKLNPDLAEGWGTLAELELKKNQIGLAAQHVEAARTLQPTLSRWRIVQARVLNRQGEPEKAAAILQALPESERADKNILALHAESCGLMRKPRDAAVMYESAAAHAPTDAEIAYQAALWFDRASDRAKAMEFAQRAAMLGHEGAKELVAAWKAAKP
jgi:predicted Zn-dependent protease